MNMVQEGTKKKVKIGDKMKDGTVYAGISPKTKKPMYAAPADLPGNSVYGHSTFATNFRSASERAEDLKVGRKKGFRVPSKDELKVLYNNRNKGALKGTFNLSSYKSIYAYNGAFYWSSSDGDDGAAYGVDFKDDGKIELNARWGNGRVRCIR